MKDLHEQLVRTLANIKVSPDILRVARLHDEIEIEHEYASVANDLANARLDVACGDGKANLPGAIENFDSAVRCRRVFHQVWAKRTS